MSDKKWPIETGIISGTKDQRHTQIIVRLFEAIAALKKIESLADDECDMAADGCEYCMMATIARDALNMREEGSRVSHDMKETEEHWVCPPCGETLTPTKARNHVCPEE